MKRLANKTFFRFLFGFISIVAVSFLVIFITGCVQSGETIGSCLTGGIPAPDA